MASNVFRWGAAATLAAGFLVQASAADQLADTSGLSSLVTPRTQVAQTASPAGGTVTHYEGGELVMFARLNADGSVDTRCTDSHAEADVFLKGAAATKRSRPKVENWEPRK